MALINLVGILILTFLRSIFCGLSLISNLLMYPKKVPCCKINKRSLNRSPVSDYFWAMDMCMIELSRFIEMMEV